MTHYSTYSTVKQFAETRLLNYTHLAKADMRNAALILTFALLCAATNAPADSSGAGNSVFRVIVEDSAGSDGLGVFTIVTGPAHPAGEGHEVLFAGASRNDAASSYLTVRSHTTGTDYVQTTSGAASANLVSVLDSYGVVEPIGGSGYRTTYALPGSGLAPDALRIVSEVEVTGSTASDSAVNLRSTVTNEGSVPVLIGVRYLLDLAPAGDDGPYLRISGSGPELAEAVHAAPSAMSFSPTSAGTPAAAIEVAPAGADVAMFASWKHAFPFAFDYTPAGRDIAGACGLNDSALLVYFGSRAGSAITLAPGQSASTTIVLSAGDASALSTDEAECASTSPPPSPTPAPGASTPVLQPVELPRTGAAFDRR